MPKKKKVLHDHKKVGSKFIPPMMQIMHFNEISYVNQILPEIIWMGLINDRYGYRRGCELVFDICSKAFAIKETDKHINFSLLSNFNSLSQERKQELIEYLSAKSTLHAYQDALLPLTKLYKDCPISFLDTNDPNIDKKLLINTIKECINKHIDKYKTPSLVIQADVVYVRNANGGLYIANHIKTPDLNALIDAPESEAARRTEGFVRNSVMSEFMPIGIERADTWARSFWNQGYSIDECDFSWESEEFDE